MEIGIVRPVSINDEMRTAYLDYAMSVIVSRALPDARDGLKPVHVRDPLRHVGYGHSPQYAATKSAPVSSAMCSARCTRMAMCRSTMRWLAWHSPGTCATRWSMVRATSAASTATRAAAMRYTEARLSAIAEELLFDIDKNTVDFRDNFDGTFREPTVLPAKLPNLLLNGAAGIAVGMATNIPPHNLTELANAIIYLIENPDATVEDLIKIIPGPDFPTAGMILGTEGIMNAYSTGRGHITLRAKAHIEEAARAPTISWSASCPIRSTRPACKSGSPRWPRSARSRASAMCAINRIAAACGW